MSHQARRSGGLPARSSWELHRLSFNCCSSAAVFCAALPPVQSRQAAGSSAVFLGLHIIALNCRIQHAAALPAQEKRKRESSTRKARASRHLRATLHEIGLCRGEGLAVLVA